MAVGIHVGSSLGEAHQSKSISLGVLSRVAENVTVLHPRRYHAELISVHHGPMERENVGMVQAFPQKHLHTKPLQVVVSSHGSTAKEIRYPCYFTPIIIWSEPQRLDRNLSSLPYSFPQVGISTRCEGYFFMRLEILVDQARTWQPPECTAQSPKHGKRGTFEISRDVRVL